MIVRTRFVLPSIQNRGLRTWRDRVTYFPLRARRGGVLVRAGQTEASVDLARMAGLIPAGVICEIMKDDGTMARVPDLIEFCGEHGIKLLTVAELIRYRLQNERNIYRVAESMLPTPFGEFRMIAYESEVDGGESHVALVYGDVAEVGDAGPGAGTHTLPGGRCLWYSAMRLPAGGASIAADDF